MFFRQKRINTGFTLVEMMVAVAIFSLVMVVSAGAIFSVVRANQKANTLISVLDNVNFALESMSRQIRFGYDYHCGDLGNPAEPRDCVYPLGASSFAFFDPNLTKTVVFRLNGNTIERQIGSEEFLPITAPSAIITNLSFFVDGAETQSLTQPKVTILLSGYAGSNPDTRSSFEVQTTVSQRLIRLE
jgi:prepilin-type N-terminal cleavage/methylation domain-containing protein